MSKVSKPSDESDFSKEIEDLVQRVIKPPVTAKHVTLPRPKHPPGWTPGAELSDTGQNLEGIFITNPRAVGEGEVVNAVTAIDEPWDQHLRDAGIDPASVDVIPPVEIRFWESMVKNEILAEQGIQAAKDGVAFEYDDSDLIVKSKMVYFKAKIRSKNHSGNIDPALSAYILQWRPKKPVVVEKDLTLVVPWSDWQLGKGDGDGVNGTVKRILNSFDQVVDIAKDLKPSRILVPSLGDMIEGCKGHYAQQAHTVQLNLRSQTNTVRRLVVQGLKTFSDIAPLVEVLPVGGNHGEVRDEGKSFTDFADNFDVGIYEAVADQLAENDRFSNVIFRIPHIDLTQTINIHGFVIGLFHGHQLTGSGPVSGKVDRWLGDQSRARHPIGDSDILLNGHFHSFLARSMGPRLHIQVPAMDGGSIWYDQMRGGGEPAGQVVFTVDENGWDNLRVLPAPRKFDD